MPKRTYIDSCVLIAAFRGSDAVAADAMSVLDDPERQFVVSSFLELGVLPKPRFQKRASEVAFMEEFLSCATEQVAATPQIASDAIELASRHDLGPLDALHVSAAKAAGVDEFVTLEGPSKPLLRVSEVNVVTLRAR